MSATINIIETTTELGVEVVQVTVTDASAPGPSGPGVPTGGTDGQVLTKTSATDYATAWEDPTGGGGGAPTTVDYLVGTASGDLSAEIVVGTSPGGELGGTWASPTVDATHSGSSHAAVQAAAEATAAAALSSHEGDTTSVHGIADTSVLATDSEVATAVSDHNADTTSVHGIADTSALALTANHPTNATFNDHSARHENGGADEISIAGLDGTPTELTNHLNDTSAAHAASAISADSTTLSGTGADVQAVLEELDNLLDDHSARHENGGADEISLAGLDGTPNALQTHLDDAADAHDASAISVLDSGANYTATDVEGVLAEIAPQLGGSGTDWQYETRSSNTILGVADKGKAIDITAAITQTFEADETLGDGWYVILRNATDDGTTVVTLNPAGTETIDGLATVTMYSGEARLVMCNGTGGNFNSTLLTGGFARFTADGNFIVPHGITQAVVQCIGGGGGGGGGRGAAAGGIRLGGTGGGGGALVERILGAATLGNPGDTIAVDVGAAGSSGSGGSSGDGSNGGAGGPTTFGSLVTGYGGGAGGLGAAATDRYGGSGGGGGSAGAAGGTSYTPGGDMMSVVFRSPGWGEAGGPGGSFATPNYAAGFPAESGGGGGGAVVATGTFSGFGGTSIRGGGGGGGGGSLTAGNAEIVGGVGGQAGLWVDGGGGSSGGTAGAVNGGAGGNGADGNLLISGCGGGGGGSQDSGTGGAGGNGGAPGGGGGGGGGGTTTGGAGGTGGRGECRVWYS